jgi:hypothetical protein
MFTIDQDKLEEITRIFNKETDPKATEELVKAEICADWHNAEDHQEWINEATPAEIAEWLASFYV